MKKSIVSLVLLAACFSAAAQAFGGLQLNPECSEFIVKEGRKRPQQGMDISGRFLFSLEDGGHVNV